MARLPTVGGDSGNWGSVLNEFLGVAHNAGGTIKNYFYNVKDYGATGDGSTDDTAAIQSAIDAVPSRTNTGGGILFFPPGDYKTTSTLTITGNARQLHVMGFGASIRPTGNFFGITISDVGSTVTQTSISGLTIWTRGDASTKGGIVIQKSWNVRIKECTFVADGASSNFQGCIVVQNSDSSDNDTGSFWTVIEDVWIRQLSGGTDTDIPYGIVLQGSANATTIRGGGISGCETAVIIRPQSPATAQTINAILIDGVALEGNTYGVTIDGQGSDGGGGSGLRIVNCRAESMTTFFRILNRTSGFAIAPYLAGNHLVSSVTNYMERPTDTSTVRVNSLDIGATPALFNPEIIQGLTIQQQGGSNNTLTLNQSGNTSRGFMMYSYDPSTPTTLDQVFKVVARRIGTAPSHTHYVEMGSALSGIPRVTQVGIRGISATSSLCHNLRGSVTISDNATSANVSFAADQQEPDATYFVTATVNTSTGIPATGSTRVYVSNRATSGFTVNLEAAPETGNSVTVSWILMR